MSKKAKSKQQEIEEVTEMIEETKEFTKNIHSYPFENERIKDRKPVRGRFRFMEIPGGTLTGAFLKYKGDPIDKFEFTDGEIYTVPLGLAKHLRDSGWHAVHEYQYDENDKPTKRVGQKIHRYTFEPLDFINDDSFNNPHHNADKEIITVSQ